MCGFDFDIAIWHDDFKGDLPGGKLQAGAWRLPPARE